MNNIHCLTIKGKSIPYEFIDRLFYYEEETGYLYWKELYSKEDLPKAYPFGLSRWNSTRAGNRCETTVPYKDYVRLAVKVYTDYDKRVNVYAHRIIWFLKYGYSPREYIDHIDGDATNNRLDNLRVGIRNNNRNIKRSRVKNDGLLVGVKANTHNKKRLTFSAYGRKTDKIKGINKERYLLTSPDYFEACCARIKWENEVLNDPETGYTPQHFGRDC